MDSKSRSRGRREKETRQQEAIIVRVGKKRLKP